MARGMNAEASASFVFVPGIKPCFDGRHVTTDMWSSCWDPNSPEWAFFLKEKAWQWLDLSKIYHIWSVISLQKSLSLDRWEKVFHNQTEQQIKDQPMAFSFLSASAPRDTIDAMSQTWFQQSSRSHELELRNRASTDGSFLIANQDGMWSLSRIFLPWNWFSCL